MNTDYNFHILIYVQKRNSKHTQASAVAGQRQPIAVAIFDDDLHLRTERHQHATAVRSQ